MMPRAKKASAVKASAVVKPNQLTGAGLGLRRSLLDDLLNAPPGAFDFLEFAPENWIGVGGNWRHDLQTLSDRHPLIAHGLSLSLGGVDALDEELLDAIGLMLERYSVLRYSEHLSLSANAGHLYDLLPIPYSAEAVAHVSARIKATQVRLGRRIAIENVSCYLTPGAEMSELEFLRQVLDRADCDLLLDVNNVYVNSVNFGFDARAYIDALPTDRIAYLHVAGHDHEAEDLVIDTHGAAVADPVWALLRHSYQRHGAKPTLLERDFNFPPFAELLAELGQIRRHQHSFA